MKKYEKIKSIDKFENIPINESIIISGTIGRAWFLKVNCKIVNEDNKYYYIDSNGTRGQLDKNSIVSIGIYKKIEV